MSGSILFEGDGFKVTGRILKTPRRTYELKNVELVTVKQPWLLICGTVGVGMIGFALSFYRYLYGLEIVSLIGLALLAILGSTMIGTLKVHSLAMRGDEGTLYGRIGTLRAVKDAVSQALDARQ